MAIVGCGEARTASVAKSIESDPIDPFNLIKLSFRKNLIEFIMRLNINEFPWVFTSV